MSLADFFCWLLATACFLVQNFIIFLHLEFILVSQTSTFKKKKKKWFYFILFLIVNEDDGIKENGAVFQGTQKVVFLFKRKLDSDTLI